MILPVLGPESNTRVLKCLSTFKVMLVTLNLLMDSASAESDTQPQKVTLN